MQLESLMKQQIHQIRGSRITVQRGKGILTRAYPAASTMPFQVLHMESMGKSLKYGERMGGQIFLHPNKESNRWPITSISDHKARRPGCLETYKPRGTDDGRVLVKGGQLLVHYLARTRVHTYPEDHLYNASQGRKLGIILDLNQEDFLWELLDHCTKKYWASNC